MQPHEPQYSPQQQASNPERTLDFPPVWQVHHENTLFTRGIGGAPGMPGA
jgi:hypothetical protein